ncbi:MULTISPECIES: hypothetical protein [unclassified Streptomyces]|uniref:hypothetical protein n=1 Tax=unclassified Streptomyces TaxID=2593676 RepID=UPI00093BD71B|nr:hypothetical protein [Streptomyces sp. TSRI0107]OKJ85588.1 hypothetical protein AMK31_16045 [Streptomyces sp. TSRI0107]
MNNNLRGRGHGLWPHAEKDADWRDQPADETMIWPSRRGGAVWDIHQGDIGWKAHRYSVGID